MGNMTPVYNSAGIEFVDLGELLAIDLVNTEIAARRKRYDLLQTPQDVTLWFDTMRALHPQEDQVEIDTMLAPDAAFLTRLKPFRAQLRALFGAITDGQTADAIDLTFLNARLSTGHVHLKPSEGGSAFKMVYQAAPLPGEPILLACAVSTMRLLAEQQLSRLHKCRNPHCTLFFYDLRRNGTREWCSIECMDRARSAERYQQLKASAQKL